MREETLFQEALSRSSEERAAFLEQACAGRLPALASSRSRGGKPCAAVGVAPGCAWTAVLSPGRRSPYATTTPWLFDLLDGHAWRRYHRRTEVGFLVGHGA